MGLAARKIYATPAHAAADEILVEIATEKADLARVQKEYEEKLEELKKQYYPLLEAKKTRLRELEKELTKLAKRERLALFAEGDRCELPHGALLLTWTRRVKRARGVLKRLEELGWEEAIVVTKKVNWDVLESWPDEKLVACGTERVVKETVEYELKEVA